MRNLTAQRMVISLTALAAFLLASCTQLKQPQSAPFFAETSAPPKQELRWSNGKSPKSLDPAKAAYAPETDIARALYEGLTDLDPRTLEAVPASAERWEASEDNRTWKFFLREDAVWSNGKKVTAEDFVRSIKRLGEAGTATAHRELLLNIRGLNAQPKGTDPKPNLDSIAANTDTTPAKADASPTLTPTATPASPEQGVVAESATVLRIDLVHPDKDLPKLLAHPIFRPVFVTTDKDDPKAAPITNGPFKLTSFNAENVILDRSENYWARDSVKLERVSFVAAASPEKALEAYREGKLDAVTNAEFSPAALKLLEPFEDFRRTAHNALNIYEVNTTRTPFNDRRVREALSLAIEREKITEGELQGTTRPADGFLPAGTRSGQRLSSDVRRAQSLLDEAGHPEGIGFPVIQLVINRNDTQQRIAKAVAQMWKDNLSIDTNIMVRDPAEIEAARASGAFDLIRRGVVLPTADETVSMLSIFGSSVSVPGDSTVMPETVSPFRREDYDSGPSVSVDPAAPLAAEQALVLTEEEALYQLRSIPLYFPTSYSLVKPYVKGFDLNALDAPSLKSVEIDSTWRTR
ncbi:MAG: peptide ABC transporter substrate-binding protein [bacterium]|nr:peptide ABC transporter substrate-binding protein [bacterium]